MKPEIDLTAYHAARSTAAYADLTGWGWLRSTGRDRLDLLHRLSTNAVKALSAGEGAVTVLTSPVGRVMAVLAVYASEDEAWLRTMPGQAAGVARYLKSMIFWQDQVEVADRSAEVAQFALYGPAAQGTLEQLTGVDLTQTGAYGWRGAELAGATASLHRGGPLEAAAWTLVVPASASDAARRALAGLPMLNGEAVEVLRIEAGVPLWDRELSEQVTPLETGLLPAVHFNKGCYTGQEVIARQTNYDKVTRNLVGLEFADGGTRFLDLPGARVLGPGRGGFVGSAAHSPTLDKVIALAVVPRDLAAPGTEVEIQAGEQKLKAIVRGLPFVAAS